MPASLNHTDSNTPMGANLIADGATFKCWAPNAKAVHVETAIIFTSPMLDTQVD